MVGTLGMTSQPALAALTTAEVDTLKAGKIVVHPKKQNGMDAVEATILINRPVNEVWAIVRDTENTLRKSSNFERVKVISRPATNKEVVEYQVKLAPFLPPLNYVGQVEYIPLKGTKFKRLEGAFEAMDGKTTLSAGPEAGQTIMAYELAIKPGVPIPQSVIASFLSTDLPKSLRKIEQAVYAKYPQTTLANKPK